MEEKVVAEKSTIEDEDKTLHEKDVLSNKQSGNKRERPQYESNPKKSMVEFKCEQFNEVFESQLYLNTHLKGGTRDGDLKCSVFCEHKNILELHINEASYKQQFNCYDCSFQANTQKVLNTHSRDRHHKPSSHV